MRPRKHLFASEHFDLESLADGVFVAYATPHGGARSNAGIIDLGDRTVVFDTFVTPRAAADLKRAAEGLTPGPVTHVVNSHAHSDHFCGNQVFSSSTTILSTGPTRELMRSEMVPFLEQSIADPRGLQQRIESLQARAQQESDKRRQALAEANVASLRHVLDSLSELEPRLPDCTFESSVELHGSRRSVELTCWGGGHTLSDAMLFVPDCGIAFIGDLATPGRHTFMVSGHVAQWIEILDRLRGCARASLFVVGHGELATADDLALQQRYLSTLNELARAAARSGATANEVLQQPLPAPLDTWLDEGDQLERNIRWLCAEHSTQPR